MGTSGKGRKRAGQVATKLVTVRLTSDEETLLQVSAQARDLPVGVFMREASLQAALAIAELARLDAQGVPASVALATIADRIRDYMMTLIRKDEPVAAAVAAAQLSGVRTLDPAPPAVAK